MKMKMKLFIIIFLCAFYVSGQNPQWAKPLYTSHGADIASASTLTLGSDGNSFDVTGTTQIDSISSFGVVGSIVTLQFDGALTLVHSADIVLPGGANVTTATGDVFVMEEYATGQWRCVSYALASGEAIAGGVTIANDANNRIITAVGDGTLNAEANVTFNGSAFSITGDLTISGLTASRLVATNGSKQLTSSITSANVAASVTNETGSGALVFGTSPTIASPTISTPNITGDLDLNGDLYNTSDNALDIYGGNGGGTARNIRFYLNDGITDQIALSLGTPGTGLSNTTFNWNGGAASFAGTLSAGSFTGTADALTGSTSGGVLTDVTVGSGLNLSSGTLSLDVTSGTFSPTITGTGSNPSITYTTQDGEYYAIGDLVFVRFRIEWSSKSGGSGQIRISNIPAAAGTGLATGEQGILSGTGIIYSQALTITGTMAIQGVEDGTSLNVSELESSGFIKGSVVYIK